MDVIEGPLHQCGLVGIVVTTVILRGLQAADGILRLRCIIFIHHVQVRVESLG